jgi:hypothetical protein
VTSQRRSARVILVTATACVAASAWGCSGGSCYPQVSYSTASIELPDNAALDCTVTFVGSTNTGAYDCPPGFLICTAEGDAPHLQVVSRVPSSESLGGFLTVGFGDYDDSVGSQFQSWLGGASFSYSVTCGGALVFQSGPQTISQKNCPG